MYSCESPNKKMHVHLRSFKCLICFTGHAYNIYAKTLLLLNIYIYQLVKKLYEPRKSREMTNCVIFFALKCQFKRLEPV
jgi:hypothetical protein